MNAQRALGQNHLSNLDPLLPLHLIVLRAFSGTPGAQYTGLTVIPALTYRVYSVYRSSGSSSLVQTAVWDLRKALMLPDTE